MLGTMRAGANINAVDSGCLPLSLPLSPVRGDSHDSPDEGAWGRRVMEAGSSGCSVAQNSALTRLSRSALRARPVSAYSCIPGNLGLLLPARVGYKRAGRARSGSGDTAACSGRCHGYHREQSRWARRAEPPLEEAPERASALGSLLIPTVEDRFPRVLPGRLVLLQCRQSSTLRTRTPRLCHQRN
jgi:hypothetical protein